MMVERNMDEATRSINFEISHRNKILTKKILVCWLLCVAVFFVIQMLGEIANPIANFVKTYLPAVEKVQSMNSPINAMAANYISALGLMAPFIALCLIWGEDLMGRFYFGANRLKNQGRGKVERLVVMYVLGVPFIVGVLFLMGAAPFDLFDAPRLAGQYVIHWMLTTVAGLVLIGSLAGLAAGLLLAILCFYLLLPFGYIFSCFQGGNK